MTKGGPSVMLSIDFGGGRELIPLFLPKCAQVDIRMAKTTRNTPDMKLINGDCLEANVDLEIVQKLAGI